jgi:hypothetical protein
MPPSYSMMLPGRMTTPLIFISRMLAETEKGDGMAARLTGGR